MMRELFEKKLSLVIAAGIGILILIFFLFRDQKEENMEDLWPENPSAEMVREETENGGDDEKTVIKVDVKGAVARPGVYEVEEGDRIIDVI